MTTSRSLSRPRPARSWWGAPFSDDFGALTGSAYVFEKVGGQWIQTSKLLAGDTAFNDRFGRSVAIDAGRIVIGARYNSDAGYGSGSAYVFEKVGGAWTETAKLVASDAAFNDFYGNAGRGVRRHHRGRLPP